MRPSNALQRTTSVRSSARGHVAVECGRNALDLTPRQLQDVNRDLEQGWENDMPNGGHPEKAVGVIVKEVRAGLVEVRLPSGHQVYANIPTGENPCLGRQVEVLSGPSTLSLAFIRFVD